MILAAPKALALQSPRRMVSYSVMLLVAFELQAAYECRLLASQGYEDGSSSYATGPVCSVSVYCPYILGRGL